MGAANNGQPIIVDVAARAGVSYQTVSRVVNGSGPVRAATRARVEQAIAQLGWVPDAAAQQLGRRRVTGGSQSSTRLGRSLRDGVLPPASLLVTGATDSLGRAVVDHLVHDGYRVTLVGPHAPHRDDVPWTRADLADARRARASFELFAAVQHQRQARGLVHLPAQDTGPASESTVVAAAVTSTYNVFAAASGVGILDVVWVLGGPEPAAGSSSALVAALVEEMARQFAAREPSSSFEGVRLAQGRTGQPPAAGAVSARLRNPGTRREQIASTREGAGRAGRMLEPGGRGGG